MKKAKVNSKRLVELTNELISEMDKYLCPFESNECVVEEIILKGNKKAQIRVIVTTDEDVFDEVHP